MAKEDGGIDDSKNPSTFVVDNVAEHDCLHDSAESAMPSNGSGVESSPLCCWKKL